MSHHTTRRELLRSLGIGAAAAPFLWNLPSLCFAGPSGRKQRLVVMFSPNGVVQKDFWPDEQGTDFALKRIMEPLAPLRDRTLVLHGLCDKVRGDGDSHMRGMGCLLTGGELFAGNIQGGSHTPAGWAKGISIDQEIKNFLQSRDETRTRFGSLEFGVLVPDRADTWTRMVYAGGNKPVAPIDDPYEMFNKLYGQMKDREGLTSILDDVREDLKKVSSLVSAEDRRLLDEHAAFVRQMEQHLAESSQQESDHPVPQLEPGILEDNDNMPKIARMQIDQMVNCFAADFARIATLQMTNSVGQARMRWLGVEEGHHELSHKPDNDEESQEKLVKINRWYCEQLAYLAKRLAKTPEPGGEGSLLDNTLIIWTNELGKGNTHTLNDIPFVLVGGGLDFQMGRSLKFRREPHNRLLLTLAHAFGHDLKSFGLPEFCKDGPLTL
jgi:hypothetical protein